MKDSKAAISFNASSLISLLNSVPVPSSSIVLSSFELELELFLELVVELAPDPKSPTDPDPFEELTSVVVISLLLRLTQLSRHFKQKA